MKTLVEIKNLNFEYSNNGFRLSDVNLEIFEKDFLSVTGRNGSGKSTLIKCLAGIFHHYSGEILHNNNNILQIKRKELAKSFSYLPQFAINETYDIKVSEFLLLGRYAYKNNFEYTYNNIDRRIVDEVLKLTNFEHYRDKLVSQLSGGEKQKCLLGLALVQLDVTSDLSGKVLIIDEPVTFLDIHHQKEIFEILKFLNACKGLTIVNVIHDLNLALKYSNRVLVMDNGKIAAAGKPRDILNEINLLKFFLTEAKLINIQNNNHIIL
ncbi:MAG TPA: ABC transporter ATP-binding protein [Ignavibacteria bacterium]|nr:ABC transporter ATP-binding protein [Ignavibacteria bacterium]